MRTVFALALTIAALSAPPAQAGPAVGEKLPRLVLGGDEEGLMKPAADDEVRYGPFDSATTLAPGKVYLVTYFAARRAAQRMTAQIKRAMKGRPPTAKFQPVNIMNLDDCLFGTCGLARGKFEDHLQSKPRVMHVIDEKGRGLKAWGAMAEGLAVYVVDHTGAVTWTGHGPFTPEVAGQIAAAVDAAVARVP